MDSNKLLVKLFYINLSIRFSLAIEFVADNIILIFSQPNVNIIDTELHPINSLHISNKTNKLTVLAKK